MTTDPGASQRELEARLRAMEDIEEIRKLKAAYCAACDDDHNGDAVAALFVPDGTWERSGAPPCHGHAEIAAYMFAIRNAGFMARSAHMVMNPVIHVDGDTATGHWRFVMMYTTADESSFSRIIGTYDETYVRHEGRWRFASLRSNVEENGRYQATPTAPSERGA